MQGKITLETVPDLRNLNYTISDLSNFEESLHFYIRPEIFFARMKYHWEEAEEITLLGDNIQAVARARIQ
jgi:hypothetical protein